MHGMLALLKENVNCLSKLSDVVSWPEKDGKKRSCTNSAKETSDAQIACQKGNPFRKASFRPNYPKTQFCELCIEDPSRTIIEMIFQRASMDPSRPLRTIERVLRVKNSIEVLERFEKHREMVMMKANQQQKSHPRSTVDGNEMLLFYGTVMTCSHGRKKKVSEFCKNPTCRLCRIIQSRFDTQFTKRNGIRLSKNSTEMCDNIIASAIVKNMKRAVVVCRTIAGRITNPLDRLREEWDSVGSQGLNSNLDYLIVRNPVAILPCFIIVYT